MVAVSKSVFKIPLEQNWTAIWNISTNLINWVLALKISQHQIFFLELIFQEFEASLSCHGAGKTKLGNKTSDLTFF